jgi:histidinol-phosphatase (PHP family)
LTLTDYHTHLRPDTTEAEASRFFVEENLLRYLEVASERGVDELGFSEHVYRFREALNVWKHPFWQSYAVDDLDSYCDFVERMKDAGHPVKLGLEVDYIAGAEDRIAALIDGRPWDYVIGSVHFVADYAVDHEGYDAWQRADADTVWADYFRAVGAAAETGLFDILAHPDLVKVWGRGRPLPAADLRSFYELAIEAIARSDVAIEVSTAGLRKPVGEIYPARELLDMCLAVGRPVALSSDAHEPEQIGYEYERALDYLSSAGVSTVSVFDQRRRREEPLG